MKRRTQLVCAAALGVYDSGSDRPANETTIVYTTGQCDARRSAR